MRVDLDHVGHRYADGPLLFHDLTASLMPGHVYACLCSMVLRPVERLVFSPKER